MCVHKQMGIVPDAYQVRVNIKKEASSPCAKRLLTCLELGRHIDPSLCFVAGDPSNVEQPASKSAQSKAWQRCQQSLDVSPEERSEEQLEQIIKYSKGVQVGLTPLLCACDPFSLAVSPVFVRGHCAHSKKFLACFTCQETIFNISVQRKLTVEWGCRACFQYVTQQGRLDI